MTLKQLKSWVLTATLVCGATTFLTACNERADHDYAAARGESLDDVAAVLDAAVCDNGNAVL